MNCESLFLSNACIGAKTLAGETMKYCLHVISLALLVGTPGCVSRTQESTQGSMLLELRKAETGDVRAQYDVGRYYVTGRDSYEHRAEAVNWFRKAAEQNDAKAQTALGVSYLRGQGVAVDIPEAVKWLDKAATQGDSDAQAYLLGLAVLGVPFVTNTANAGETLRKMADHGNSVAELTVGLSCLYGRGSTKNLEEGKKWIRKAAVHGDALAQALLGRAYFQGLDVATNYAKAAKWSRKAAEENEALAQETLGRCCQEGKGVKRDEHAAVDWFRRAAEQGDEGGQMSLGLAFRDGRGVARDVVQAYKWLDLAAIQGDPRAISARLELSRQMSTEQLAEAGAAPRLRLAKFDREIIDAHEQKYAMSCIPSSVEMVLKLTGRVPGSYYEQQTAWKNKADGSFHNFDGKTIAGFTFHQQFIQAHGRQFPLAALFETIDHELRAGRFVIIGLPAAGDTHDWVIYDEDASGEFLAVSKAGPRTIENNHVKKTVTEMQGTDIGTYELKP
jgi:TPR repeat protein